MLRKVSTSCNPSASVLDDCALQLSREQCLLLYWTSLSCCTSATSLITQDYLSRPTYLKGHQPIDSPDAPPPDAPPQTHHLQTHLQGHHLQSHHLQLLEGASWQVEIPVSQLTVAQLYNLELVSTPLPCTAPCHCLAQHYLHATALHSTVSLSCTALSARHCLAQHRVTALHSTICSILHHCFLRTHYHVMQSCCSDCVCCVGAASWRSASLCPGSQPQPLSFTLCLTERGEGAW